ncbi:MAG: hypothetical protein PHD01_14395 [Geobacteraceae bacterium]|nr:hypothetical protein [Geobacteraceae bacterium]
MHKAMIVTLAALAALLLMPLPGSARESRHEGSQPQGSYSPRSSSSGSFQRGTQPGGSFSQRSVTRQGEFRGVQPRAGYRGTYPRSGYRSGGYRYGGYPHYRSNVYFSGGVWLGPGWDPWWGWPYSYPYYYYPYYSAPPVVIEQSPTEYIERGQESEDSNYWYHCSDPEGYYPTIQRCPSGWTKEIPSSPPEQ